MFGPWILKVRHGLPRIPGSIMACQDDLVLVCLVAEQEETFWI